MSKIKIKDPKQRVRIPEHEITMMLNLRKEGKTLTEVKNKIDSYRKDMGTFKGQGISSNTVSRLLSPKTQEAFIKDAEFARIRHAGRQRQKSVWEKTRDQIKDPGRRKEFDKAMKRIIEGSKGVQSNLDAIYIAETDEWYVESG